MTYGSFYTCSNTNIKLSYRLKFVWNSYLNFPYGGYIYNSSYPVYLASNICPPEKPYYNSVDGQCIYVDVNIVKNSPSGSPDKIFNSDLPGYVYEYTT